jgi:hypothetical protein
MSESTWFVDHTVALVSWNSEAHCWEFDAGPIDGRSIPAYYIPEEIGGARAEQDWERVRNCVLWIRANEARVRDFIKEKVHDSWLRWRCLTGINFDRQQEARLIYGFVGVVISVHISATGEIIGDPTIFVSG